MVKKKDRAKQLYRDNHLGTETAFIAGWTEGEIEALTWVQSLCMTGQTVGMLRLRVHNRIVELEGKGEKA